MKSIKSFYNKLLKDESAQGVSEYILLLVVVIAVAFLFKNQIIAAVKGKMDDVSGKIGNFGSGDGG
ncbi:MAG: hypothetical protein K1X29_08380 [Bdellovibrionales bacterium]|nr:hypothetical protein [Bdellovibrionales bacterium]